MRNKKVTLESTTIAFNKWQPVTDLAAYVDGANIYAELASPLYFVGF